MCQSVCGSIHAVVHHVASVEVELQVRRHGCFDLTIKSLLHLHPHIFVVVFRTELLVELLVFLRGVETLYRLSSGSSGHGITSFATKSKQNRISDQQVTYVAFMS